MSLTTALLLLLQVGPNPAAGGIPDYSEEIQNRPPRTSSVIGPAQPAEPLTHQSPWLKDCLELVEADPARAHVQAQVRAGETQGQDRVLAQHCLGLAATKLERWDDAIGAFTSARDGAPVDDNRFRARLGTMAASAQMGKGDVPAALSLLEAAQRDAEAASAADLQAIIAIEQSRALVAQGRLAEAEPFLVHAQSLRSGNAEAPLLLATLLRKLDRLPEAQAQIEAAIALAPLDPLVGLEAGVIAVLAGRDDAARASWQSVVDVAPGTQWAQTAQSYLAQIADRP